MRSQSLLSALPVPAWSRPSASSNDRAQLLSWHGLTLHRLRRLSRRLVMVVAVGMLVVALGLIALRMTHAGRVYPGVFAGAVNLGGLTHEEARAALQKKADDLESNTIVFSYGGKTWTPTLSELGAHYDVDGTLQQAYAIGRDSNAGDRLRANVELARANRSVPFRLTLDHSVLGTWFDTVDRDLGLPPHDAYLAIQGPTVTIVPEVDGRIVDRTVATARVRAALRGMAPISEPLPIISKTAIVRASDLGSARDHMTAALAQPVRLTFGQASWTLTSTDIGAFVVQRVDPAKRGAEAFSASLDLPKLAEWLYQRLAPSVNQDPVDAEVGWNQGPVATEASVDGVRLRPMDLAKAVEASFFTDHGSVVVPVDVISPKVDSKNLGALGITKLLARGDSNYAGSAGGRGTNVDVGAYRLNGTLVPPGGEFSFNHAIGVINEENGFVEAQVIDGERIGRDIGGGICQVSTTVFRAALLAGLPITEWWPHKYRIPFYEADGWTPGLDASILQPEGDPFSGGDFKFENPTGSWILVESWTTGTNVVVNIYGADTGYDVNLSEPAFGKTIPIDPDIEIVDDELPAGSWTQSEVAQEGIEVTYTREVFDATGELVRSDNWYTLFWSRGNVYKVSPDMACESPAGNC